VDAHRYRERLFRSSLSCAVFQCLKESGALQQDTRHLARAARRRNCELTCTASKTPPHLGRVTETWPNKFVRVLGFDHLLDGKQNLSSRVHHPQNRALRRTQNTLLFIRHSHGQPLVVSTLDRFGRGYRVTAPRSVPRWWALVRLQSRESLPSFRSCPCVALKLPQHLPPSGQPASLVGSLHRASAAASAGVRLRPRIVVLGTFFKGGLRAYDISDPYQPKEVGIFVPPAV
jgi:hypothetical protein